MVAARWKETDMTLIRVNPASVQTYGTTAQATFEAMRGTLESLVDDVVGVHYYGPNSVQFKTQSGQLAAQFANSLNADMGSMANSVRTSTSNIAGSLGGSPISIEVVGTAITPDEVLAVDYVDVDTTALESLIPVVTTRFTSLREGLASHLTALQNTDWAGNAKDTAVEAVSTYTTSAVDKCNVAEESITTFIRTQIDSVTAADV